MVESRLEAGSQVAGQEGYCSCAGETGRELKLGHWPRGGSSHCILGGRMG